MRPVALGSEVERIHLPVGVLSRDPLSGLLQFSPRRTPTGAVLLAVIVVLAVVLMDAVVRAWALGALLRRRSTGVIPVPLLQRRLACGSEVAGVPVKVLVVGAPVDARECV